jgi:hypothetical protein
VDIEPTDRAPRAPATYIRALQRPLPLTDAQKLRVASNLAVSPARLCPATAQRIHEALRNAGIHGSFGKRETIEAAGFDSFDLLACAPAAPQTNWPHGPTAPALRPTSCPDRPACLVKLHLAPRDPYMKPTIHRASWFAARCLLPLLTACGSAGAHELQENRATLVQREAGFVAMTLYIDMPEALHRSLAPQRPFAEFAAAQASLAPDAFKAVLLRATTGMQSQMRAMAARGQPLAFERWVWPDAPLVQAALRERLMEAVVARGQHLHTVPSEVRAELHSVQPLSSLRVQFTPALGRVMVVSYRPRQVWVEAGSPSPAVAF